MQCDAPQLGKLKKCIQLCKCRALELHITPSCSLILFYFDFYLQASTIAKFRGGMHFLSPALRQTDLGNATEINSAKKMQELNSSAFKSQIMANRRLNFSPRVHMHHDSLHTPHAIPQLLQYAIICLKRQTVVCRAAYLSPRGRARLSSQHIPFAMPKAL